MAEHQNRILSQKKFSACSWVYVDIADQDDTINSRSVDMISRFKHFPAIFIVC